MNRKSTPHIPEPIVQLQRELDQFRSTRPRRTKLPESLWQAAVELARQYGVYSVAQPLRLDYMGLKKRLGGAPSRSTEGSQTGLRGTDRASSGDVGRMRHRVRVREAERRCVSSGRHQRRRIGPACCAPGGTRKDDSDHGADARCWWRSNRWTDARGSTHWRGLCQDKLAEDPFSGCVFVFRSRRGTSIRLLSL